MHFITHQAMHKVSFRDPSLPPPHFVRVRHCTEHVNENQTRGISWFHATCTDRFEVVIDDLQHRNDQSLPFSTVPTVTLRDLHCKGEIRINRKSSLNLKCDNRSAHCRRTTNEPSVKPVERSRWGIAEPVHLPNITLTPPTCTQLQDNICYLHCVSV